MENLSLKEFAAALSGKEPVPGGGGAQAPTGKFLWMCLRNDGLRTDPWKEKVCLL